MGDARQGQIGPTTQDKGMTRATQNKRRWLVRDKARANSGDSTQDKTRLGDRDKAWRPWPETVTRAERAASDLGCPM